MTTAAYLLASRNGIESIGWDLVKQSLAGVIIWSHGIGFLQFHSELRGKLVSNRDFCAGSGAVFRHETLFDLACLLAQGYAPIEAV